MTKFFYLLTVMILTFSPARADFHYQNDFAAEDFRARRDAVYDAVGDNIAIIQGGAEVRGFINFRQSNTFYYLSGLERPSSYMLLDGRARKTTIYLPHRDTGRERGEGHTLSYEDADLIRSITGAETVRPVEMMATDFAFYLLDAPFPALYTPHSPDEKFRQSRDEIKS